MECLWLGVQLKTGAKTLQKRIVKVTDRNQQVGDMLVHLLDEGTLIDSVECYSSDPDVKVTAPPTTLTLDVPISIVWENFGGRFLVARIRETEQDKSTSTNPASVFDVLMMSARKYEQLPDRRYVLVILWSVQIEIRQKSEDSSTLYGVSSRAQPSPSLG